MNEHEYYYEPTPWGFGSTHSISYDGPEKDVVDRLREVVEEVTGKPVEVPPHEGLVLYEW